MRANRVAHEQYAQAHYPVWTHPEMLRHLCSGRGRLIADTPCEETLDVLCHVNYNLWHTDFLDYLRRMLTGRHTGPGSDPFSGLRKVVESARGTLTSGGRRSRGSQPDSQGRPLGERRQCQRQSVDEMIEDAMEDVATAEGQLAEALGEPTVAACPRSA